MKFFLNSAIRRDETRLKGGTMRIIQGILLALMLIFLNTSVLAGGNQTIDSFSEAKRQLKKVYADHRTTFYCQAPYKKDGSVEAPQGFESPKFAKRSKKIEWEHIVPAENFGRAFPEWREGHEACVDSKGKPFKGRKCAEKVNKEFQFMVSDMYNLVPAIGSVNAMRSNFNFTEMHPSVENTFGTCPVKIVNRTVEPGEYSKGSIARTYFYIESKYPTFKISDKMRKLLSVWNKRYPVDKWECERALRIEKIQKNRNDIVMEQCKIFGFVP